jgi:hypothetical protein
MWRQPVKDNISQQTGYELVLNGHFQRTSLERVKYEKFIRTFDVDAVPLLRSTSDAIRDHARGELKGPPAEHYIEEFAREHGMDRREMEVVRSAALYYSKVTLAFWGITVPELERWCHLCRKPVSMGLHDEETCRREREERRSY